MQIQIAKVKDAYKEVLIPILRKDDYLIYQRSEFEESEYSIKIDKVEKNIGWLKYLLISLLFGIGYAEA